MESEFEIRIIKSVNIDSLSIEERVFITEIILKDKPIPTTRSLLNIIKQQYKISIDYIYIQNE